MSDFLVIEDGEVDVVEVVVVETLTSEVETHTIFEKCQQGPPGPPGAAGASGIASPPTPFAFGDASPRTLFTTAAASLVLAVSVNITTPFNGAAPSIRIGTAAQPELLIAAVQSDLTVATEFEVNPNLVLGAAQEVLITLVPGAGATQGAGWIVIEQIPTT